MFAKLRSRLTYANVMATVAVFIALGGSSYAALTISGKNVKDSSLTGKDVKNRSLTAKDIKRNSLTTTEVRNRSLLAKDFKPGQVPAGSQGPKGDKGDRGPSFGDGKQVENFGAIPCGQDTVVGSQPLRVGEPSRIWIHGHGTLLDNASDADEYSLWLRLRNAADTATLAVSTPGGDIASDGDQTLPLSSGGLLKAGDDAETDAPAFVAPPGTYTLQLVVIAVGACSGTGPSPQFGFNQDGAMGYMLVGNG